MSAFRKEVFYKFPRLKSSEKKKYRLYEVDFTQFPSEVLNFVVECIHPNVLETIPIEMNPPDDARLVTIDDWEPYVVITILGHNHNQLIQFENGKIKVHHFNDRYSANRQGTTYKWEAIGVE